jgi:hypothetical protein
MLKLFRMESRLLPMFVYGNVSTVFLEGGESGTPGFRFVEFRCEMCDFFEDIKNENEI